MPLKFLQAPLIAGAVLDEATAERLEERNAEVLMVAVPVLASFCHCPHHLVLG